MVAAATSIISAISVTVSVAERLGKIVVVSISSAVGMQSGGKGSLIPEKKKKKDNQHYDCKNHCGELGMIGK